MKVTFQEISLTGTKSVKCIYCGKRLTIKKKFYQTVSPFNRLQNGTVKSTDDIYYELRKSIQCWKLEQEKCKLCTINQQKGI